jgi:hypothetical protein
MIEGRQERKYSMVCPLVQLYGVYTLVACVRYRYVQVANKKII